MASWIEDTDWSYLKITGPDKVDYFHRLTTNRVPKPGEPAVHSFLLSTNARVIAEFWMKADADFLYLMLPKAQLEQAKENIERYHFNESFELLEPQGKLFVLVGLDDAALGELKSLASDQVVPDPRYGKSATWVFVEEGKVQIFRDKLQNISSPLTYEQLEAMRLDTGRPRYGTDYTQDTLFLEMAQEGDFSENKGCYPGQEVVARVLHRGRLNRHLRAFESIDKIPSDWTFKNNGKEMARVTTSVSLEGGSRGLLYVRREVGDDGAQLVGADAEGRELALTICPRPGELPPGDEE